MNPQQQLNHFEKLVDQMRKTLISKGNDYAGKQDVTDRLSNFKSAGAITNTHPAKVALIIAAVKISRMCTLLDAGVKPDNESLEDSALDFAVYSILNHAILTEEKEKSVNA